MKFGTLTGTEFLGNWPSCCTAGPVPGSPYQACCTVDVTAVLVMAFLLLIWFGCCVITAGWLLIGNDWSLVTTGWLTVDTDWNGESFDIFLTGFLATCGEVVVLGEKRFSSLLLSSFPGGFLTSVGELLDWTLELNAVVFLLNASIVPPKGGGGGGCGTTTVSS